jgi:hypothetical protein
LVTAKERQKKRQVVGLLGVGLDNRDGEHRITRADHFLLVGGSEETHERMQETAIRFNESLAQRGEPLEDTPVEVVVDLLRQSQP